MLSLLLYCALALLLMLVFAWAWHHSRTIGAPARQREAEALTGLQVGGISALALLSRGFEICIERAALTLPPAGIHISAGQRGANIRLGVQDLIDLTGAKLVETG